MTAAGRECEGPFAAMTKIWPFRREKTPNRGAGSAAAREEMRLCAGQWHRDLLIEKTAKFMFA
jgi:hypothetical protein